MNKVNINVVKLFLARSVRVTIEVRCPAAPEPRNEPTESDAVS